MGTVMDNNSGDDDDLGETRAFGANMFPTVVKALFPEALKGLMGDSKRQ